MDSNLQNKLLDLKKGSHIILMYKEISECIEATNKFIEAEIKKNNKVICVIEKEHVDLIKNNLEDIETKEGQLKILSKEDIYDGELNINKMINLFQREAENALKERFEGLSITGEISFVLNFKDSFEKIIDYEKKIDDELLNKFSMTALCRYNIDLFDESLINKVIELHSYIIWKSKLYKNPYYISLDSFSKGDLLTTEVEETLNNIKHYQEEKEKRINEIESEKASFKFLFNQIDDALFLHGISKNGFTNFERVNETASETLGYSREELQSMSPKDIDSNRFKEEFYIDKYNKLVNNKHVNFETEHVTKDGEIIPVENKSHLFEYEGKKLVLTVARDIKSRIEKENKLKAQYKKTKEKNKELKISNNRLNKLVEVITKISKYSIENENEFLIKVFRALYSMIPNADFGSVYKYNGNIIYLDAIGHDIDKLNKVKINSNNFKKYKKVVQTKDIHKDLKNRISKEKYKSFVEGTRLIKETLAFDIKVGEKAIGGIGLDISEDSDKEFDEISFSIFSAFKDIVESFYKIQDYNKLRGKFTKELALSLIHILEFHDEYTTGHSENVAILASDFAEYLDLDKNMISQSYWAGLVHDIGKIVVPSYILNKEGKLTKQEYEVIKNHPKWAYETLKRSKQLSQIAEYVLYHHERWDGNGYPQGIKGESIPLASQILSICDSWDAMRTNRSYRDALTYNQAIDELENNKDKQHSGELVNKFIKMLDSENNILFSHK